MRRAYRPELLRYGLDHWVEKKKTYASLSMEEKRNLTLEDFEFSHRVYSTLRRAGIKTVGDIIDYGNLSKTRMFGVVGYKEVYAYLKLLDIVVPWNTGEKQ